MTQSTTSFDRSLATWFIIPTSNTTSRISDRYRRSRKYFLKWSVFFTQQAIWLFKRALDMLYLLEAMALFFMQENSFRIEWHLILLQSKKALWVSSVALSSKHWRTWSNQWLRMQKIWQVVFKSKGRWELGVKINKMKKSLCITASTKSLLRKPTQKLRSLSKSISIINTLRRRQEMAFWSPHRLAQLPTVCLQEDRSSTTISGHCSSSQSHPTVSPSDQYVFHQILALRSK